MEVRVSNNQTCQSDGEGIASACVGIPKVGSYHLADMPLYIPTQFCRLQCAVPMQFCADTCMQLLHGTSRSKICVVIGMQGSLQSLCVKDPYSSEQWETLTEIGSADLYRYTRLCCQEP